MTGTPGARDDNSSLDPDLNGENGPDKHRDAFWSIVVGVPTVLSIIRLWVEAGGELQTTLLLVSHVGPLNLVAALFTTASQPVTVVLVALFTIGGMLRASARAVPSHNRLRIHPPVLVRLHTFTPAWFLGGTFLLAALTWKIFYLPLLLPALAATFQRAPWEIHERREVGAAISVATLIAYYGLVGEAVWNAWRSGEVAIVVLLVLPPLVAFLVTGPAPEWFARTLSQVSALAIVPLMALVIVVSTRTPVLPLVATEVISTTATGPTTDVVRGHVVDTNDLYVIMLEKRGGIQYLDKEKVGRTVLCGTPAELPAFTTRVHGFHVENSPLTAIGRLVRPPMQPDPLCRANPPR